MLLFHFIWIGTFNSFGKQFLVFTGGYGNVLTGNATEDYIYW